MVCTISCGGGSSNESNSGAGGLGPLVNSGGEINTSNGAQVNAATACKLNHPKLLELRIPQVHNSPFIEGDMQKAKRPMTIYAGNEPAFPDNGETPMRIEFAVTSNVDNLQVVTSAAFSIDLYFYDELTSGSAVLPDTILDTFLGLVINADPVLKDEVVASYDDTTMPALFDDPYFYGRLLVARICDATVNIPYQGEILVNSDPIYFIVLPGMGPP